MGTKEWLKDNSTKETKGVQNRDKVIMVLCQDLVQVKMKNFSPF